MSKWYEVVDEEKPAVLFSGARLNRNFAEFPFPVKLTGEQAEVMCCKFTDSLDKRRAKLEDIVGKYYYYNMMNVGVIERAALAENMLITKTFQEKRQSACFILNHTEDVSVMINEEDHIRMQVTVSGLDMQAAYCKVNQLDDFMNEMCPFSYHERLGYLTSNPNLVGTGLTIFAVLHLPALAMSSKIEDLKESLKKRGVILHPVYSDIMKEVPYFYEISNSRTLGLTEQDIITLLEFEVNGICLEEKKRRKILLDTGYQKYEDLIYRSYGVLKYAKLLTTQDAILLLGQLKFGFDEGIMKTDQPFLLNKILRNIQPANLQLRIGREASAKEREKLRANYLNQLLPNLVS